MLAGVVVEGRIAWSIDLSWLVSLCAPRGRLVIVLHGFTITRPAVPSAVL